MEFVKALLTSPSRLALYFSQTRHFTLHENTNKDQPKTNQPSQKVEFQTRKEQLKSKLRFCQKYEK